MVDSGFFYDRASVSGKILLQYLSTVKLHAIVPFAYPVPPDHRLSGPREKFASVPSVFPVPPDHILSIPLEKSVSAVASLGPAQDARSPVPTFLRVWDHLSLAVWDVDILAGIDGALQRGWKDASERRCRDVLQLLTDRVG